MPETPPLTYTNLLYRSHEEIRSLQNQRFRHQVAPLQATRAAYCH